MQSVQYHRVTLIDRTDKSKYNSVFHQQKCSSVQREIAKGKTQMKQLHRQLKGTLWKDLQAPTHTVCCDHIKTFTWIKRVVILLQQPSLTACMYHGTVVVYLPGSPKFPSRFCHREDKGFQSISFLHEDG